MINSVYQLVAPRTIMVKFSNVPINANVIVRPTMMSICNADQRYFQGKRDPEVLRRKLPMALIHEASGKVLHDPTGTFEVGDPVVLVPNVPGIEQVNIFENYSKGSKFCSSNLDGFMQEFISISPNRLIRCEGIPQTLSAITEFISVAVHAYRRFKGYVTRSKPSIAVIGDGSLAYTLSCVLDYYLPDAEISVIGHNREKLLLFSFVSECFLSNEVPSELCFDHFFECAGGDGAIDAIDLAITHANPQATLNLLGVSEYPVPIFTRFVLEKGMTLIGCSRSGYYDFKEALSMMRDSATQSRLAKLVYLDDSVIDVKDIKRVFSTDLQTPFKTVFPWEV